MSAHVDIAPDVRAALDRGAPVVALETTIVTHGMPYPQNVETAPAASRRSSVRAASGPGDDRGGSAAASIGIDRDATLERIAVARSTSSKLSRADLPYAVAAGERGATTVAATMICAHPRRVSPSSRPADRRRPSRRGGDVRCFRRSRRARAHAGRRSSAPVRRRSSTCRRRGAARNARRPGDRLSHR